MQMHVSDSIPNLRLDLCAMGYRIPAAAVAISGLVDKGRKGDEVSARRAIRLLRNPPPARSHPAQGDQKDSRNVRPTKGAGS